MTINSVMYYKNNSYSRQIVSKWVILTRVKIKTKNGSSEDALSMIKENS